MAAGVFSVLYRGLLVISPCRVGCCPSSLLCCYGGKERGPQVWIDTEGAMNGHAHGQAVMFLYLAFSRCWVGSLSLLSGSSTTIAICFSSQALLPAWLPSSSQWILHAVTSIPVPTLVCVLLFLPTRCFSPLPFASLCSPVSVHLEKRQSCTLSNQELQGGEVVN